MSTVNRHTLKKANQSHRKRTQQSPIKQSRSPLRPVVRSAKRLWKSRWLWIFVVVVVVFLGLGSWYYGTRGVPASSARSTTGGHVVAQATATAILTPTATPDWQTVHTFKGPSTGDSTLKLQKFTVSGNWQITWVCQGVKGVDDWLYIAIYNPDGSLYNAGAQVTCLAAKQIVGSVQEAKSGEFYLTVDANTAWTVTVQDAP